MSKCNETVRGNTGLESLKAGRISTNLNGGIKSIIWTIRDILTGFVLGCEYCDGYDFKALLRLVKSFNYISMTIYFWVHCVYAL